MRVSTYPIHEGAVALLPHGDLRQQLWWIRPGYVRWDYDRVGQQRAIIRTSLVIFSRFLTRLDMPSSLFLRRSQGSKRNKMIST